MTLTTPYLARPINPFSSEKGYEFPFVYSSGEQMVRNNLVIQKLSNNEIVYDYTIETFTTKHPVSSNVLENGIAYRAKIRVGSVSNQWSQFSDWSIFWVLASPTLFIDNIDYANQNRVYNQTVTFSSTYTHPNGELLQSFRYNLYDSNKRLLQSYKEQFSDGSLPLTQDVAGLSNGGLYYIELRTISVNNQETTTGLILVRPFYIEPRLNSAIGVENTPDEGAVKITANIIQIVGKLYDNNGNILKNESIEYVLNDKIDLNKKYYDKLIFTEGFDTESEDFVLKLWCENIPDNVEFLRIQASNGYLKFTKYNDMIHIFKYVNGVTYPAHYRSNVFTFESNVQFMLYAKSQSGAIDIKVINAL